MKHLEDKLKKAGLAGNEAKVYLELLKRGSINGSSLAKKIGLDRTLTYQVLNNLIEKGLINFIIKENKKFFTATDPEKLLIPIKEKEELVNNLIPELKQIKKLKEIDSSVEVYEGKSGLKILFDEILSSKEVCFFGSTGKSYEILLWNMERIEKEFSKKKVKGRGIASKKVKDVRWSDVLGIDMRYIDIDKSQNTSFGIIDKKKVGIICLEQEKPQVIMIKNKFIAQTLQNYFEFMWRMSK